MLFWFIFLISQTSLLPSASTQQTLNQPVKQVTFKLLAVEAEFNNTALKSAQHLIKNLKLFNNWQNGTSLDFQYFTYIHLLSSIEYEAIDSECQMHYVGKATRQNIVNEITTFLNQTLENDYSASTFVFYYAGETGKNVSEGKTSFYIELDEPLFDWEIDALLPSNQPQKTIIILDTPHSGGYITELQKPGRIVLAACNPAEETISGWFTGDENAFYSNGTAFGPMGIVGALHAAEDTNRDGWLCADEIFRFSWKTLVDFASAQTTPYYLHPMASYGVTGGALPLIQLDPTEPYYGNTVNCAPETLLPNSSRYNWSQMECHTYRYSVSRTGFADVNGTRTPDLLWVLNMNASIMSSQVVADGILYVTTLNGKISALDLETGNEIWMFNTNSSISSTPSVDKGLVIFGTEKPGKIYALDAYNGFVRWLYEIPEEGGVYSSPAIFEEKVVIGSSDGYLYCLSQFEGELLWVSYIGGGKLSSPAIADNTIFITSPHIYAVNLSTGYPIWRYTTNWPVYSSPAVADSLVFVGAENDDKVFAFEQKTGRLVWSFQTGGWLTSPAVDSGKKLVVAGCRDARVYCLNEFTGFLKWRFINAPNHLSAPTITRDGLVYIGSTDGNLYCLDEETGMEIWKYNVGSPIIASPVVVHQHVIVASEEGKLFCFGLPFPTHNIAISNAKASPSRIREGEQLEVNFTIENRGDSEEKVTITISLNCSNKVIKQFANLTASPGENLTYTLYLNSTGIPPGYCNIIIEAQTVPDETDASDNAYSTDIITIIALVDINADGEINIMDIYKLAAAYGTEPGHLRWNPDADVNRDNIINIFDVFLLSKKFGEKYL